MASDPCCTVSPQSPSPTCVCVWGGVCVCLCVCYGGGACLCVSVRMCMCTYACVCARARMSTCGQVCVQLCVPVHSCACVRVQARAFLFFYVECVHVYPGQFNPQPSQPHARPTAQESLSLTHHAPPGTRTPQLQDGRGHRSRGGTAGRQRHALSSKNPSPLLLPLPKPQTLTQIQTHLGVQLIQALGRGNQRRGCRADGFVQHRARRAELGRARGGGALVQRACI